MEIRLLENFIFSFQKMYEYNSNISIKYANRIKKIMLNSIERLKEYPYIGKNLLQCNNKKYREIICQKYRIIYSLSENNDIVYIHYLIYAGKNFRALFKIYNKKQPDR